MGQSVGSRQSPVGSRQSSVGSQSPVVSRQSSVQQRLLEVRCQRSAQYAHGISSHSASPVKASIRTSWGGGPNAAPE